MDEWMYGAWIGGWVVLMGDELEMEKRDQRDAEAMVFFWLSLF